MKSDKVVKNGILISIVASSIVPLSGYFIIGVLTLYLLAIGQGKNLVKDIIKKPICISLVLYIIFTLLNSKYKSDSIIGVLFIFILMILYQLIRKYILMIDLNLELIRYFILSNIIIGTLGIVQFYFFENPNIPCGWIDSNTYTNIKMRAYSTLINPNVLAGYLVFTISFLIISLENIKLHKKRFISILISTICLILTYSRGAWATLIVVILVTYIYRKKIIYIIYACIFYISIILINLNAGLERLNINRTLHDSSLDYRIEIYRTILRIIKDNFVFGTGINTMKHYIDMYSSVIKAPVYHGHNIVLSILGEIGFVGFVIFVIITVTTIKSISLFWKTDYKEMGICTMLGTISIFVHGLIDAVALTPQFLFFIIYIFATVINMIYILIESDGHILNQAKVKDIAVGGNINGTNRTRDICFKKSCNRIRKKYIYKWK